MSWGNLRWARLPDGSVLGRQYYKTCQIAEGKFRERVPRSGSTAEITTAAAQDDAEAQTQPANAALEVVLAFRMSFEALEKGDPVGDGSVPPRSVRCGPAR